MVKLFGCRHSSKFYHIHLVGVCVCSVYVVPALIIFIAYSTAIFFRHKSNVPYSFSLSLSLSLYIYSVHLTISQHNRFHR